MKDFEKVDFIHHDLKKKIIRQAVKYLDSHADKLSDRGCDDLENQKFTSAELVLMGMEYHKRNGDFEEYVQEKWGFSLGQESTLVCLISYLLEDYLKAELK